MFLVSLLGLCTDVELQQPAESFVAGTSMCEGNGEEHLFGEEIKVNNHMDLADMLKHNKTQMVSTLALRV